jgi:hypothetical protein
MHDHASSGDIQHPIFGDASPRVQRCPGLQIEAE